MDLKVLWTISDSMGTVSDLRMLKDVKTFNVDVVTTDVVDKESAGFAYTGKKYIVPSGSDFNYIDSIVDICRKEDITTIIPQYGDELVPLSEKIKVFENMGVKVLVTEDVDKLKIANDKKRLYEFFDGSEFIPDHRFVSDIEMLEKSIYDLGYPGTPVCIKPAYGEGGKGFRTVTDEKIDIFNGGRESSRVSLDVLKQQLRQSQDLPEIVVMEYLPGEEYSVDCVCKNGVAHICIPRKRVESSMGVATVSVVERNDEVINLSKLIANKLKLSYNVNIQFKYSSSGKPKLVDINPRVSGSLVANLGAGINMLEMSLRLAYGLPLEEPKIKWGTKMIRYWDQIYIKA